MNSNSIRIHIHQKSPGIRNAFFPARMVSSTPETLYYVVKGRWPVQMQKTQIKLGKNRQKDRWFHFHACMGELARACGDGGYAPSGPL